MLDIFSRLVQVNCIELDELIAATGVLPRAMEIALDHHVCNSASNAATRMLAGALASSVEGLCLPLLQPQSIELQARLARECTAATTTTVGLRKCHIGALISMANLLRQLEARCPLARCTAYSPSVGRHVLQIFWLSGFFHEFAWTGISDLCSFPAPSCSWTRSPHGTLCGIA